jgi:hypothetical protein
MGLRLICFILNPATLSPLFNYRGVPKICSRISASVKPGDSLASSTGWIFCSINRSGTDDDFVYATWLSIEFDAFIRSLSAEAFFGPQLSEPKSSELLNPWPLPLLCLLPLLPLLVLLLRPFFPSEVLSLVWFFS